MPTSVEPEAESENDYAEFEPFPQVDIGPPPHVLVESIAAAVVRLLREDGHVVSSMSTTVTSTSAQPAELDWISTVEAARLLQVDRGTLDGMVDRAPRSLPGAPVHVGRGKARRHLRWSRKSIHTWLAAYREWEATRGRRR